MRVLYNHETDYEKYKDLFTDLGDAVKQVGQQLENQGKLTSENEDWEDYVTVENMVQYFRTLDFYITKLEQRPQFRFYRVPLDEPTFKVDMDTRKITIPEHYVNNGLGVCGDTNAEIIIFEIDRLFDIMDLDAVEGCWIQWQNTSSKKSGNSVAILSDATEDKLYAAWVVSSEMTDTPGNIDFALRFFTTAPNAITQEPEIVYSVSTQKATCSVKPTLNLRVLQYDEGNHVIGKVEPDNFETLIMTRPIYSGVINSMKGAAPRIITDLKAMEYNLLTSGDLYEEYKLGFPEGVIQFAVEIESPDGGKPVYQWYSAQDLALDPIPDQERLESDDPTRYFGEAATSDKFVATKAGTYFCKLGNENKGTGTRWVDSAIVTIPHASTIEYGDDYSFPHRTYSILENSGNVKYEPLKFDIKGANGVVKYEWTITDLSEKNVIPVEQYSSYGTASQDGTFLPKVGAECVVSAKATNHKNNTVSNELVSTNKCIYRAMPSRPTVVDLTWNGDSKKFIVEPTFSGASANHENEWEYVWKCSRNGSEVAVSPTWFNATNKKELIPQFIYPTQANTHTIYTFTCSVKHVVYASEPGLRVEGLPEYSRQIVLQVHADGTITDITNYEQ